MSVQMKDSKRILDVGVVGCGEVAQIVHVRFFQFSRDIPIHMTRGLMGSYLISCLLLTCIVWLRFVMSLRSYLVIVEINSMFRKNIDMGICTFLTYPWTLPPLPLVRNLRYQSKVQIIETDNDGIGRSD